MNNPFYGKDFEKLYVRYVINRNEDSNKDGFGGLFSFYNTAKNGRVSFQSAPYICYNTADGFWFDSNHPFTEESTNMAPYMEAGHCAAVSVLLSEKMNKIVVNCQNYIVVLSEKIKLQTF